MDTKKTIMWGMTIGSTLGGLVPSLWDAGAFSISSVIFGAIGGFLGIWIGYQMSQ